MGKLLVSIKIFRAGLWFGVAMLVGPLMGCAGVKQYQREILSDPIMQRIPDELENGLKSHNLPRREGSSGGSSGSGGGCGC